MVCNTNIPEWLKAQREIETEGSRTPAQAKEQVPFHGVLMSRELRDYIIRETK